MSIPSINQLNVLLWWDISMQQMPVFSSFTAQQCNSKQQGTYLDQCCLSVETILFWVVTLMWWIFFNLELFFVVRLFRKQDLLIISREVVLLCSTTLPISQLWRIPTQYSVAKGPNYIWYVKNHNEQSLILWKALSATVQYMHKCIKLKVLSV